MDDIKPKLRQPEKMEHVQRMQNVDELELPWLSQFAAAELNKLWLSSPTAPPSLITNWLSSPTVPPAASSRTGMQYPAYYTYDDEEQLPEVQRRLTQRQMEMNAEQLAIDDALAASEVAEHGRALTDAQRLLPPKELAQRLRRFPAEK